MQSQTKTILTQLFHSGVAAVQGQYAVQSWFSTQSAGQRAPDQPSHILAVGKAAGAMFEGLEQTSANQLPGLVITKHGHLGGVTFGKTIEALETAHPIPNQQSLQAGAKAMSFVENCPAVSHLLMLVSGGASSLVEHLIPGVTFAELVEMTVAAMGDGADIADINRRRRQVSAIKGGKLLGHFRGRKVTVLAISDVQGDGIDVIGSGIGAAPDTPSFDYDCHIIGSNAVARAAVARQAQDLQLTIASDCETLYADVAQVADMIAAQVQSGPEGLYIFGGEPTVVLPKNPGLGGRNQALALELARRFDGINGVTGLVAGTDGSDGPTDAAGGFFDGQSFRAEPGAEVALQQADSASYLLRSGYQFTTGPTGTNVMDLALVLKEV